MGGFEVKLDEVPRNKPIKMTFDVQSDDPDDPKARKKWGVVMSEAVKTKKGSHELTAVKATGQVTNR